MSNYDEVKRILKKTGLLFSEWRTSGFKESTSKREIKELSLVVATDKDEVAEFVFAPNGTFLKIRPVEKEDNNVHRHHYTHIR